MKETVMLKVMETIMVKEIVMETVKVKFSRG